ncbi:MAG TPA: hypothetical protein DDX98_13135 [Bacteroidales bacterium]|jgi:7-cyano-7-deazaguanine synthase|nr:hypothetical protein [Bacteroidales bacterium]
MMDNYIVQGYESDKNRINKKIVLCLSGGFDSTALLFYYVAKYGEKRIFPVYFHYGQKNRTWELYAVGKALGYVYCKHPLQHFVLPIPDDMKSGIINSESSKDQFDEPDFFMPNRNALMLSIAFMYATTIGATTVGFGAVSAEHNYPDDTINFYKAFNNAMTLSLKGQVSLETPFILRDKRKIYNLFESPERHFLKEISYSCGNGSETVHSWGRGCGVCSDCKSRMFMGDK